jgi:hypothetical protein
MFKSSCVLALLSSFVVLGSACSANDETVGSKLEVFGKTSSALSAATVTVLNGTYTECLTHTDGSAWKIDRGQVTPSNSLDVVKNDTACKLHVTSLETAGSTYTAASPILLGSAFPANAVRFTAGQGSENFFGNAKMDIASFAANFTITVVVGDTSGDAKEAEKAYAMRDGAFDAETVLASNYEVDLSNLIVEQDANGVVDTSSGYAILGDAAVDPTLGTEYVVLDEVVDPTSSVIGIKTAYAGAAIHTTIVGSDNHIPAARFHLDEQDLTDTLHRTIIVKRIDNTDVTSGNQVTSYQIIDVTFDKMP